MGFGENRRERRRGPVRKRIKLFYVIVMAFVIIAGGLMAINRLDQDIAALEDTARETRLRKLALDAEGSSMTQEIAIKDTDSYIRKMAREGNRFMMSGDIRFVVTNPEALYAPGEMPGLEETPTEAPEEPSGEDNEG